MATSEPSDATVAQRGPLRVLFIEDSEDDTVLLVRELRRAGYQPQWERVDTAAGLAAALARQQWDVVTCDYAMPRFSAAAALQVIQERGIDVPVIIVSGEVGEEVAVSALKAGALDYVSKHRLARLAPAIERECREAALRRARARAEDALRESRAREALLLRAMPIALYVADPRTEAITWVSDNVERLTQLPRQRFLDVPHFWQSRLHADDRQRVLQDFDAVRERGEATVEFRFRCGDDTYRWFHTRATLVTGADGVATELIGTWLDISERKQTEQQLQASLSLLQATLESTADGLLVVDRTGQVVSFNRTFAALWRLPEALLATRDDARLLAAVREQLKDPGAFLARVRAIYADPEAQTSDIVELADGRVFERYSQPQRIDGAIVGRVWSFRDVTERRRAEGRTAALLDVARAVSGHLQPWEMLERVQRRIVEVLPCDGAATFYWDPPQRAFRMVAQHGLRDEMLRAAEGFEIPPEVEFIERLRSLRTVVIDDVGTQGWVPPELFAGSGASAVVWTQLHVRGHALGVLVAFNTGGGRCFDRSQVEMLEAIAGEVAVAIETDELYQEQRSEAAVGSALARVGRELIGALDSPGLLDRLCRLTTEVLACDCSHTVLWQPELAAYVPVAGHGYAAEQWEWIRVLRIPRQLLAGPLQALAQDDVVVTSVSGAEDEVMAVLARQLGLTQALCMALRRGRELIGFHAACNRGRPGRFGAVHERIGRGVAQLASLALSHAHFVDKLSRANQLKSEFVATVSHELRSPLNAITGYTDLLLEGAFGPLTPEQGEAARRLSLHARELLDVITATLDLSRVESGAAVLDRRPVSLAALLADIEAETAAACAKPGVHVAFEVAADLPPLSTDPLKLKVVVKNLLLNAVKFTERGGVTVSARARDGGIEVAVRDTGIGMSAETQAVIFEPFRQASEPANRRGGVGLGLYIVRRLLELLGGTIAVDSFPGHGSTFHVWVPAQGDAPGTAAD